MVYVWYNRLNRKNIEGIARDIERSFTVVELENTE